MCACCTPTAVQVVGKSSPAPRKDLDDPNGPGVCITIPDNDTGAYFINDDYGECGNELSNQLVLAASGEAAEGGDERPLSRADGISALATAVRALGGSIKGLTFGRCGDGSDESNIGVFAAENLEAGTVVLTVPAAAILAPPCGVSV